MVQQNNVVSTRGRRTRKKWPLAGFTLLELLVVIAITGIILTLLFAPLIQGFNITRRARAIAAAQDAARTGLTQMRRELSQAAFVFDNTNQSIVFPMQKDQVAYPYRLPQQLLTGAAGTPYKPALLFTKIDFITAAQQGPNTNQGQYVDPTTNTVVDKSGTIGSNLRFPLAPGTHLVRYFIGLRRPFTGTTGNLQPAYYGNPYEFARSGIDDDFNPFILYRAEIDLSDAATVNNFFDTTSSAAFNDKTADNGGFNDPDFFYNINKKAANGLTYAENWAKIAQPVMNTQNLDLLVIRRTQVGAINVNDPFRPTVTFLPSAVTADTATPGFLTNDASELPGAVPTLYTSKYGAWTTPFTVTFYRGTLSSAAQPSENTQGQLSVRFSITPDTRNPALVDYTVTPVLATNSLATDTTGFTNFYCSYSPTTGKYFISTPNLTYIVDPERGRIETGLPPLVGKANTDGTGAVPWFMDLNGNLKALSPGIDPLANEGELVETVFRINTRDDFLINSNTAAAKNQGFTNLHLLTNQEDDPNSPRAGLGSNYYLLNTLGTPLTAAQTPDNGTYPSPRAIFGPVLIASGTERLIGPDSTRPAPVTGASAAANVGNDLVPYFRVPLTDYERTGWTTPVGRDATNPNVYRDFTVTNPGYYFDYDFAPYDQIIFVNDGTPVADNIPGLPSVITASDFAQKELRATYYWQNNFARFLNNNVTPPTVYAVDSNGNYANRVPDPADQTSFAQMGAVEADVVKVDYSTRSLINVNVGARVYDSQSGAPQLVQLSDKVQINNGGR